ncbi:MAG: filamentous hemagglutinin N-terminal domain-containing protein [Cyanobacteria bacterium P01_F01_bin.143]
MFINNLGINSNSNCSHSLGLAFSCLLSFVVISPTQAQIIPDNTLGAEGSIVVPQDAFWDLIEGGAIRDNNLFHSFSEFNVNDGARVDFANPEGIANILTRVTGNNISEIFGTLGVNGGANLFLLNPNGIIFGENASLDVSGSFLATTADSYIFNNGFAYSASNPEVPPLLTINIPIGLQFGDRAEAIVNRASDPNDFDGEFIEDPNFDPEYFDEEYIEDPNFDPEYFDEEYVEDPNFDPEYFDEEYIEDPNFDPEYFDEEYIEDPNFDPEYFDEEYVEDPNFEPEYFDEEFVEDPTFEPFYEAVGLEVSPTQNLTLIGGNILFEGGIATAPNGSIEIGSVAPNSLVKIITTENHWTLDYTGVESFQDINLTNAARIDSSGDGGGNIQLQSRQINLQDGSIISADSYGEDNAGILRINATEKLDIFGTNEGDSEEYIPLSTISADAFSSGQGNDIEIHTQQLLVRDGGIIRAEVFEQGNGGNISIQAKNIAVTTATYPFSTISTQVNYESTGQGGNLTIEADDVLVRNSIMIVDSSGVGDAGDIDFNINSLRALEGSQIGTGTFEDGQGGNISIQAKDIKIDGVDFDGAPSGLFSVSAGNGDGGDITINAQQLIVSNNAGIDASNVYGTGNSGDIEINVGQLILKDGASQIATVTAGEGDGGNLIIRASESIEISGTGLLPTFDDEGNETGADIFASGLFATVEPGGIGKGGNLIIETGDMSISDGAEMFTNTSGEGNAGNISIRANNLEVRGTVTNLIGTRSGITTAVEPQGIGDGGNLEIIANNLSLIDGGSIAADSLGKGNAGNLNIQAQNINISGVSSDEPVWGIEQESLPSSISAFSAGDFAAGLIDIESNTLNLSNQGTISVSNLGDGKSGNLNITSNEINLDNFATIEAKVNTGSQGNINLTTDNILLNNNSEITALATGTATGGNIRINNTENILLSENSQIIADAIAGNGGNIDITTQGLFVSADSLITASSMFGLDGNINIDYLNENRLIELNQLPDNFIDETKEIIASCNVGDNKFAIAGQGGFPENPGQYLRGQTIWQDLRLLSNNSNKLTTNLAQSKYLPRPRIIEAQTWKINQQGNVELLANIPSDRFNLSQNNNKCWY